LGKDIGDRVVQESCQLLHELRRRR
jgi:hypothetical protein